MISQQFYKDLNQYQDPDILKVPLDKMILQINEIRQNLTQKITDKNQKQKLALVFKIFENPFNFFSLSMEKIPLEKIENSIEYLLQNYAIVESNIKNIYDNTFFG